MNDLLAKLQSMGLKIEKANNLTKKTAQKIKLEQIVDGSWIELTEGRVFIVKKSCPYGHMHGRVVIESGKDLDCISILLNNEKKINSSDLIFIDTETSSLSTGTGTFVFLIGIAQLNSDGLSITQFFLDHPVDEKAFLCFFEKNLSPSSIFISYNGKAFDIPMLKNRFILNRLPNRLNDCKHLDLLHAARNIWKMRLESRKLADIEKEILNFHRSNDEIPGWLVPQLYYDYLESGDAQPMKGVFYHNEMDVLSLAAILFYMNDILAQNLPVEALDSRDSIAIGSLFSRLGLWEQSDIFFQTGFKKGLPGDIQRQASKNYAFSLKKQKRWEESMASFKQAADKDDLTSCIELAKYHEHRYKDYRKALFWTDKALFILKLKHALDEEKGPILLRKRRLENKLNKDKNQ